MRSTLTIVARILPDGKPFTVTGRNAWTLGELVKAGQKGCTPIDNPALRWSAYVFNLRRNQRLVIETRHEAHRGPFAGWHGRYVLVSAVEIISRSDEPTALAA
jgi:hypothetical protein